MKQLDTNDYTETTQEHIDSLENIDAANKMIAIAEVNNSEDDFYEIKPLVDQTQKQLSITPAIVEADKGYANIDQIIEIESSGKTRCSIPLKNLATDIKNEENGLTFVYFEEENQVRCQSGKILKYKRNRKRNNHEVMIFQANCSDCDDCPLRAKCTDSKKGRTIWIDTRHKWKTSYKKRMESKLCKQETLERKAIVEHVFGTIKRWMGKVPLLLTGKKKVQIEIDLYTTSYNMLRLTDIEGVANAMQRLENYAINKA